MTSIVLLLLAITGACATQIITNPSFEDGTMDTWGCLNANCTVTNEISYDGIYSLKLTTLPGQNYAVALQNITIPIQFSL